MSDPDPASPTAPSGPPALGPDEIDTARRYAEASRAASTRRAYQTDWRLFSTWCAAHGLDPLPGDPRIVACAQRR